MSRVKVGDVVSVAKRGIGRGVETFWYMNPNFVSGKVLEIFGDDGEYANVEVTPGGTYWSVWTESLTVVTAESKFKAGDRVRVANVRTNRAALGMEGTVSYVRAGGFIDVLFDSDTYGWSYGWRAENLEHIECVPRKIEFDDVKVGDLIRATRIDGENSYVKTLRVVKRSPRNSNMSSEGGLEAVMLWQHETEGNRVNATIELLDRPEKAVLKVGDVVGPDALYEVDTKVVVRYVDNWGEVVLAVIHETPTDLVGWDSRTKFEIIHIEKESA